MDFKEIDFALEHSLTEDGITPPTPEEERLIKKIKQGNHNLVYTENMESINRVLYFSSLIKAPRAFEGSPRVLWITNSNDRALELAKTLQMWVRRSEIAVETANESGKIIEQRNHIFEGADILIGTPKRMLQIYNQNGIHVNQLSLIIIDELDTMSAKPQLIQCVRRICESIEKCQKLLVSYGKHDRLEDFAEEICYQYDTITF